MFLKSFLIVNTILFWVLFSCVILDALWILTNIPNLYIYICMCALALSIYNTNTKNEKNAPTTCTSAFKYRFSELVKCVVCVLYAVCVCVYIVHTLQVLILYFLNDLRLTFSRAARLCVYLYNLYMYCVYAHYLI